MCFARVLRQWMWWALGPCLLVLALTAHTHELPPTLAQSYHPGIDVQAYWVSEKYDGVRALWTGEQLLSRQGLPLRPVEQFPAARARTVAGVDQAEHQLVHPHRGRTQPRPRLGE